MPDTPLAEFRVTAGLVEIRDPFPFPMPAFLVSGDHAAGCEETFGHRAAALLGLAQCAAAKLVAHPWKARPHGASHKAGMMPCAHIRDLIDQKLFCHAPTPELGLFGEELGSFRTCMPG